MGITKKELNTARNFLERLKRSQYLTEKHTLKPVAVALRGEIDRLKEKYKEEDKRIQKSPALYELDGMDGFLKEFEKGLRAV